MSAETIRWLIGFLATPIVGFVWWVIMSINKLKNELDAQKLHVAEEYTRADVTEKIFAKLDKLSEVVFEIAGSLKIPVKKD